jgi:peptide/nickel transport system substrate-binding protein
MAARRPVYGGELVVEMRGEPDLTGEVYETLVRVSDTGEIEPWLAVSWTHDEARRQWVFAARPNVTLHNGELWNPPGGVITMPDDKPVEQILRDLTRPKNAVMVHLADGNVVGTGPFRLVRREPGRSARLEAHETYWRGRPFLNGVEIRAGRSLHDQALDFDLKRAGLIELEVTDVARERGRGIAVELSRPRELLALVFDNPDVRPETREAFSLLIDRESIRGVLLGKQGEATGALLPQWLTGYAFLFPGTRDVARAKALVPTGSAPPIGYRDDTLLRAVAERIAANASAAGIVHMFTGAGSNDVTLRRIPLLSPDSRMNLEDIAGLLRVPMPAGSNAGSNYEAERALLATYRIIPLVHLPQAFALGPNVRGWAAGREYRWEDLWLE